MTKRILSIFLILPMLLCALAFPAMAVDAKATLITDPTAVSGSDYTTSTLLAERLDAVFAGNASVYSSKSCTSLVDTALGLSPMKNNGVPKYVGTAGDTAVETGTSCWIYANGVYYTLFGESTGDGEAGENSEKLSLRQTADRTMCYENFRSWGVRQGVGALIRASGHSMILLGYDAHTVTILDGNGDGNGLIAIRVQPWEKVFGSVSYIIQPTERFYSALTANGMCGEHITWSLDNTGTLTISGTGEIQYPAWRNYSRGIRKVVVENGGVRMGSALFCNCDSLTQIVFQGAAPVLAANAFLGVKATVQYPASQPGWSGEMLGNYGGLLTWKPYGMTQLKITAQPQTVSVPSGADAEISITAEGDGLCYTWYTKNSGDTMYIKSSITGSSYCMTMSDTVKDRQVLCVVKDLYGNYLISQSALLRMETAADAASFSD